MTSVYAHIRMQQAVVAVREEPHVHTWVRRVSAPVCATYEGFYMYLVVVPGVATFKIFQRIKLVKNVKHSQAEADELPPTRDSVVGVLRCV